MIAMPIWLLLIGLAFIAGFLIGQFDVIEKMEGENDEVEN